ncbi:AAA-ATPase ASD mitochondrial [Bienertia sinuspersici]
MLMMMNPNEMFMQFGSVIATIIFMKAIYEQYIPHQWRDSINSYLYRYTERIVKIFSPYNHISFDEYEGGKFKRSEAYTTIETYLSERISMKARGLKANFVKDGKSLVLGLADNEEVTDEFQGVKVWWNSRKTSSRSQTISFYPGNDEKRHYQLTFHSRHKKLITESYLTHILDQGKEIAIRRRQRKLFTNVNDSSSSYGGKSTLWSHIEFNHPATFDTLAMEKSKKQAIINDIVRFSNAKDYYKKIGKPWKRGYLLYGPPGTGKSTMIVVMANLLGYDIYDLELTAVKDNTQLRRLLIETSSKSIIVIEDIDCSLDLTGQRSSQMKEDKDKDNEDGKQEEEKDLVKKKMKEQLGEVKKSEVTLSGLLNFIDGIWSACGEERLIIFTTNYIEKLDPALIRKGRMDVHIELSYCSYEAFKVLAWNYLDVESHPLFERIKRLLEETKMTPADVGENLMPKLLELDVDACLENLVRALEKAREDDQLKVEQEEKEKLKAKVEELEEDENKLILI